MKFADFIRNPDAAQTLQRLLRPAAALYLVLALALGGRVFLLNRSVASDAAAAKRDSAATFQLRKQLDAATRPDASSTKGNNGAVAALQSLVEKRADAKGCSVTEFQASSETQPYLSRFAQDTPQGPWMQVEVLFSVKGRLPDVYGALTGLSEQGVPFEPSSLELVRDGVSSKGAVTVVAKVQGRVLSRGGSGS